MGVLKITKFVTFMQKISNEKKSVYSAFFNPLTLKYNILFHKYNAIQSNY